MVWFRKWLILIHRYLGIGLGLLFVVWFVSGIGMMYAGAMPELSPEERLARMPGIDWGRVKLTPAEAAEKGELGPGGGRVVLLTVNGQPAYRFTGRGRTTVLADTGAVLDDATETEAIAIAARFMNVSPSSLHDAGTLTEPDQWTIGNRRQMPLHKIVADDPARTELYVSEPLSEVSVVTTRRSRAIAWVSAIPHWLYFVELRRNNSAWRQTILWTSGAGSLLALLGLALGIVQYRTQYAGLMRWHYVTGVVFGLFTLTWVFSGWLSMQPWDWTTTEGGSGAGLRQAFTGRTLNLASFPVPDATAWKQALGGRVPKEVEFVNVQGEPHYLVRGVEAQPTLMTVNPLAARSGLFPVDSLIARFKEGNPEAPIREAELLSSYDSYYYARSPKPPLPVLRIKVDDPDEAWFYIDPRMSQPVARFSKRERVERWIYHGFHSLDFAFWYDKRPLWDIGVLALLAGGTLSSGIGFYIGVRRLIRNARRLTRAG
jgi:hypothetical protein